MKQYHGFVPIISRFGVFLRICTIAVILSISRPADAVVRLSFDARPNRQDGDCTSNRVQARHKLVVHYTAIVNDQEVIDTRTENRGKPVELIAGVSQTGWDHALLRLCCVGDQVTLKIEPPDIPYGGGMERVMDKIPKGSTVIMKIEIMQSEPLTKDKLGDYASALFKNADVSRDGKLTPLQFQQHFKPKNIEFGTEEYKEMQQNIEDLFQKLDKDQDNKLSLSEFTQAKKPDLYDKTHLTPRHEFDHFDKNKDGKLDKKEIKAYYKGLKMKVPKDYWKYADVDEDGFISFPEFTRNPNRDSGSSGWSDEL